MKVKIDKNELYNEVVDLFVQNYSISIITKKQDKLIKEIVNLLSAKYDEDAKIVEYKASIKKNEVKSIDKVRKKKKQKKQPKNKIQKIALITDTHQGFSKKTHRKLERFYKELAEKDFDILIHTGDWISYKQEQLEKAFKLLREHVKKPIVCVFGNHDYWNPQDNKKMLNLPLGELFHRNKELCKKYKIQYLGDKFYKADNVLIAGLDGWYAHANPPTNDKHWMPKNVEGATAHMFMQNRAHKEADEILKVDPEGKKMIIVTHFGFDGDEEFGANRKWEKFFVEKCDILCCGHSHMEQQKEYRDLVDKVNNCRIFNAGSDYDKPKYIIFDINGKVLDKKEYKG